MLASTKEVSKHKDKALGTIPAAAARYPRNPYGPASVKGDFPVPSLDEKQLGCFEVNLINRQVLSGWFSHGGCCAVLILARICKRADFVLVRIPLNDYPMGDGTLRNVLGSLSLKPSLLSIILLYSDQFLSG
jgi:hypothetical protein